MNKSIFITGGTSGIGKALINQFAKNNYNIFFTYYKNLKQAKIISKNLKKLKIRHDYIKMDLSKTSSIDNTFRKFSKKFNKFSIFINNASPEIKRQNFLQINHKDILKKLNALLLGNIVILKNTLKCSLRQKNISETVIINISSYSAITGGKGIHLYAAAKAALNTLSKALSEDKYKKKIKVISVIPRFVDTYSFRKNNNIKNQNDLASFKKLKKVKSIKKPTEFSEFICDKIIKSKKYKKKQVFYFHTN